MKFLKHTLLLLAMTHSVAALAYDMVINNGRLIDPHSGVDAIRSVAVEDGKIVAISASPFIASKVIDAEGMVVAPGFINLHTHSPTPLGQKYELLDGITTSLDLEAGAYPVEDYAAEIEDTSLINFGASAGHIMIRAMIIEGDSWDMVRRGMSGRTLKEKINARQRRKMERLFDESIERGALGIGLALDYVSSAVDEEELDLIFRIAGKHQVPVFVHVRRYVAGDPAGLIEVVEMARKHKAPLQVVHINASAMGGITQWLEIIDAARADGVDVTTEMFPYNAGSAAISSAVFYRNWREIFDIEYEDVQWSATGEWMTEEKFRKFQDYEPAGLTIHHYIREHFNRAAIVAPYVMAASDAMPLISHDRKVVPNGMGTSSRILGRYVRQNGMFDLNTAIEKLSLLPARRLESFAPAFRNKGRLTVGADADITIFDPETVIDNATYEEPFQPPTGIEHVIINGIHAVSGSEIVEGVYAGRRMLESKQS